MAQGETEKSIAAYGQAVELAPTLAPPRVNLGAQLLQSGRLPEAEAVSAMVIALRSGLTRAEGNYLRALAQIPNAWNREIGRKAIAKEKFRCQSAKCYHETACLCRIAA